MILDPDTCMIYVVMVHTMHLSMQLDLEICMIYVTMVHMMH